MKTPLPILRHPRPRESGPPELVELVELLAQVVADDEAARARSRSENLALRRAASLRKRGLVRKGGLP